MSGGFELAWKAENFSIHNQKSSNRDRPTDRSLTHVSKSDTFATAARVSAAYTSISPRGPDHLWQAPPGVVVVVADQLSLSLHTEQLQQAARGTSVFGSDDVRGTENIHRPVRSAKVQHVKLAGGCRSQTRLFGGSLPSESHPSTRMPLGFMRALLRMACSVVVEADEPETTARGFARTHTCRGKRIDSVTSGHELLVMPF